MKAVRQQQPWVLFARSIAGAALVLLLSLLVFSLAMRPAAGDFGLMATFLTVTAVISMVAGYAAVRMSWIRRSPHLRWTLLAGYALSSLLTFLNVWMIARLMFASQHDLQLATILLLFATGIAMALGYFLSGAITDSIVALNRAARQIAAGNKSVRVPEAGRDELAELARSFNDMSVQLEAAARKQDDLNALRNDLIAWVGHDLRTPLTSIRAIVEALADGVVDDPQTVQRYLRTAQHDIRTLSMLIDDLFDLSLLDTGGLRLDRQPNSISDLVSDLIERFCQAAGDQGVHLEGSADPGVDPVLMDARKIERVLANLIDNALLHTPSGGTVSVHVAKTGGEVRVEVRDTGEGIKAGDLPHVFERFYRGDKSRSRATGGSGLGLAIARGFVEAHGGTIGAESTVGQGTRFFFTLPAA